MNCIECENNPTESYTVVCETCWNKQSLLCFIEKLVSPTFSHVSIVPNLEGNLLFANDSNGRSGIDAKNNNALNLIKIGNIKVKHESI